MINHKLNAIYSLYSSVKKIDYNNEDDTFIARDIDGEEVSIDMSAVNTKATELQTAKDNEAQAKKDAQVSGNQKLLDLGLTQAEATALTGYTPPSEV
jgi:hypothetical protein